MGLVADGEKPGCEAQAVEDAIFRCSSLGRSICRSAPLEVLSGSVLGFQKPKSVHLGTDERTQLNVFLWCNSWKSEGRLDSGSGLGTVSNPGVPTNLNAQSERDGPASRNGAEPLVALSRHRLTDRAPVFSLLASSDSVAVSGQRHGRVRFLYSRGRRRRAFWQQRQLDVDETEAGDHDGSDDRGGYARRDSGDGADRRSLEQDRGSDRFSRSQSESFGILVGERLLRRGFVGYRHGGQTVAPGR